MTLFGSKMSTSETCRSCMFSANPAQLQPLTSQMEGDSRSLSEVLSFVAGIQINSGDTLPQHVCTECISIVRMADSFKRKCHNSDRILKRSRSLADNTTLDTEKHNFGNDLSTDLSCEDCTITFDNFSEFFNHMQRHDYPYQCSICQQRYANQNILEQHLCELHKYKSGPNKYECDNCEKKILGRSKFIVHMKVCTNNVSDMFVSPMDHDVPDAESSDSVSPTIDDPDFDGSKLKAEEDEMMDMAAIKSPSAGLLLEVSKSECDEKMYISKSFKTHKKNITSNRKTPPKRKKSQKPGNRLATEESLMNEKLPIKYNKNRSKGRDRKKTENFDMCVKLEEFPVNLGENPRLGPYCPMYNCTKCERKFSKKESFQKHLSRHEIQANQIYICSICKREFKHRAHLDNHVLSVHTSDNGLKCDYCPKSFSSQESLDLHLVSHKEKKKHQCQNCQRGFSMLSTLKDHMRTHTGEKPFLCSTCGRGFSQKTNLKEHMRRHNGDKPHKCDTCDRKFVSKGELVAHSRRHSGAHPFVCDVCKAGFTTSSSLMKHRRTHTGERPYECGVCPMRFTALGTLKNHRRTHTGEKPYKCTQCQKAFAQRNDLVSHVRCHTGERPYVCTVCGQCFRQSSALKTHFKLHAVKDTAAAPDKHHSARLFTLLSNPETVAPNPSVLPCTMSSAAD